MSFLGVGRLFLVRFFFFRGRGVSGCVVLFFVG